MRHLLIWAGLFTFLLLAFRPVFFGPDSYKYAGYTRSFLEHGDLNLITEFDWSGKAMFVSRTWNYPDFHNHGGVVAWLPFGASALTLHRAVLKPIGIRRDDDRSIFTLGMAWSTAVFAFLTLLFSYHLCHAVAGRGGALPAVIFLFLGTPMLFYSTVLPGNGVLVAAFFSCVLLVMAYRCRDFSKAEWALMGGFYALCVAVKVDLLFHAIVLSVLAISAFLSGRSRLSTIAFFLPGFLPIYACRLANDYLRLGSLQNAEAGLLNLSRNYLWEELFSRHHGYFFSSPIFYLFTVGAGVWGLALARCFRGESGIRAALRSDQAWNALFVVSGVITVLVKLLVISFRFDWGGGTPGARFLVSEFPIMAACLSVLFRGAGRRIWIALAVPLTFWHLAVVGEFILVGDDMRFLTHPPGWLERAALVRHLFEAWAAGFLPLRVLRFKLYYVVPFLVVAVALLRWERTRKAFAFLLPVEGNPLDWPRAAVGPCKAFALYGLLAYLGITGLNLLNNQRRVESLRSRGYFAKAKTVDPTTFIMAVENVPSMNDTIRYFTLMGLPEKADSIRAMRDMLIEKYQLRSLVPEETLTVSNAATKEKPVPPLGL